MGMHIRDTSTVRTNNITTFKGKMLLLKEVLVWTLGTHSTAPIVAPIILQNESERTDR